VKDKDDPWNASINVKVRSADGATHSSRSKCTDALAFAVWMLVSGWGEQAKLPRNKAQNKFEKDDV